ncbi:MAG: hypothetical protein M3R46_14690 [Actinomycetota bacterium]|nr:hypothetical protein [Solirubrobacterales bacterium]MDQ3092872.1 hypothetical protein [Actinomycetota bacterium]
MSSEQGRPPTEDELSQAYEEEMKRIKVEDVLVQTLVSLLNLGGRRAGLVPGAEEERDPQQLGQAIEGARALLPLVEGALGEDAGQIRQALSQLQMAFARLTGAPLSEEEARRPDPPEPAPQQPGGPQQPPQPPQGPGGGRLWIPGQ